MLYVGKGLNYKHFFFQVLSNNRIVSFGEHPISTSVPVKSTNITLTVTEQMDPYAQFIVYYFGELYNWNADSMYFNIYHGSNMFKNKVCNSYHNYEIM